MIPIPDQKTTSYLKVRDFEFHDKVDNDFMLVTMPNGYELTGSGKCRYIENTHFGITEAYMSFEKNNSYIQIIK
jgi:hypothetical protein